MVVTGGLYALRVRTKTVVLPIAPPPIAVAAVPQETIKPDVIPPVVAEPEPEEEKSVQREVREELEVGEEEQEVEEVIEPVMVEEVVEEVANETTHETIEDVVGLIEEVAVEEPTAGVVQEEIVIQEEPEEEPKPVPTFEHLGDGSIRIFASDTIVTGTGTQPDPFVLDWVTLRAIERVFNPKKGKDELPAWLDVLNGKYVKIKGNTLVPVIATTTRELLVMQNPWDGCCIGIPPSPYDAIEVELDHDVDFGSSAVGYGVVEGVFILDPYVVDGWVLGLYMIEQASYRSGEGVPFPDF